jgi:hypothetical protein
MGSWKKAFPSDHEAEDYCKAVWKAWQPRFFLPFGRMSRTPGNGLPPFPFRQAKVIPIEFQELLSPEAKALQISSDLG